VEHEKNNETALQLGDNFSKAVAEPAMLQHETNASDKKVAKNEVQTDDVTRRLMAVKRLMSQRSCKM